MHCVRTRTHAHRAGTQVCVLAAHAGEGGGDQGMGGNLPKRRADYTEIAQDSEHQQDRDRDDDQQDHH